MRSTRKLLALRRHIFHARAELVAVEQRQHEGRHRGEGGDGGEHHDDELGVEDGVSAQRTCGRRLNT